MTPLCRLLFLGLLLVGFPVSASQQPINRVLAQTLIRQSSLGEMLQRLPDNLQPQLESVARLPPLAEHPGARYPEVRQLVMDTLLNSLSAEALQQQLIDYIAGRFSNQQLQELQGWLQSTLGQQVTRQQLQVIRLGPMAQNAITSYVQSHPKDQASWERINLMRQLVKHTQQAEHYIALSRALASGLINNLNAVSPRSEQLDNLRLEHIRRLLDQRIQRQLAVRRQTLVVNMLYTYRRLNSSKLRAYLAFLQSAPGLTYQSLNQGLVDIVEQFLNRPLFSSAG